MHFYIDESGHTGLNLFDVSQPVLYYGVLSSKLNVDVLAADAVKGLRQRLGVQRLHAAELGNKELAKIASDVFGLVRDLTIKFSIRA
jgi:hypothetical protein